MFKRVLAVVLALLTLAYDYASAGAALSATQAKKVTKPTPTRQSPEGMVFVKGGCFDMGDIFGGGAYDTKPVHRVCLNDYYMDKYEVTNAEFERWKPDFERSRNAEYEGTKVSPGDRNPVVAVTWDEAKGYCESVGKRLPTEAEWENAARERGKNVQFGTGKDTIGSDEANIDASYARGSEIRKGEWRKKTLPVGSFSPNALGLHDMCGNVEEWVADWYDENYYKQSPKDNPQCTASGRYRVLRGGSWWMYAIGLYTTSRGNNPPGAHNEIVGFRCAQ